VIIAIAKVVVNLKFFNIYKLFFIIGFTANFFTSIEVFAVKTTLSCRDAISYDSAHAFLIDVSPMYHIQFVAGTTNPVLDLALPYGHVTNYGYKKVTIKNPRKYTEADTLKIRNAFVAEADLAYARSLVSNQKVVPGSPENRILINLASAHFEANSVAHVVYLDPRNKAWKIKILDTPDPKSFLNDLAVVLRNNLHTDLIFSPVSIIRMTSNYKSRANFIWFGTRGEINMPVDSVFEPKKMNIALQHEIDHAKKRNNEGHGMPDAFYGSMEAIGDIQNLPYQTILDRNGVTIVSLASKSYGALLSFDEIENHLKDNVFKIMTLQNFDLAEYPYIEKLQFQLAQSLLYLYARDIQVIRVAREALNKISLNKGSFDYSMQLGFERKFPDAVYVVILDRNPIQIELPLIKSKGASDPQNRNYFLEQLQTLEHAACKKAFEIFDQMRKGSVPIEKAVEEFQQDFFHGYIP
jgi:hypothetical protein